MKIVPNLHPTMPIALAEASSTMVSLGALWTIERHHSVLQPLKEYLSRTIIYPSMAKRHPPASEADREKLQQRAADRASILIKGVGMVGAGFASHVPIQMALEGKFDKLGLRDAGLGKGVGLAVSLGSIMLLNRIAPSAIPALENFLYPLVKPFLPKDERGRETRGAEEVAKLLMLDIPSSIIAGLVNYSIGRKLR